MLRESLEKLPGDARTQLAVITYDASSIHLYVLQTQNASPAPAVERVPSDASSVSALVSHQPSATSAASATPGVANSHTSSAPSLNASQNGLAQSNNLSHSQTGANKCLFRMLVVTDIDDLWDDAST